MRDEQNKNGIKPGARSVLMVVRLLGEALIDLVLLPFRLAAFLFTRKKTVSRIERLLRDQNPTPED